VRRLVPLLAALALLGPPADPVLAAPAPSHAVQGPIGCTTLSQGDHGFPVRVLQGDLSQLGLFGRMVTGLFGRATAAALERFQRRHGLSATGVLDAGTLAAIKRAMQITGPDPSCATTARDGSTSGGGARTSGDASRRGEAAHNVGVSSRAGPASGGAPANNGGSANGGSLANEGGAANPAGSALPGGAVNGGGLTGDGGAVNSAGASTSRGAGAAPGALVHPLGGIISPPPRAAIDYEYTWITPGFALGTGLCAQQSAYGAWDARHGYAGIVLDLGNPLGLQARAGLTGAEAELRAAETCFAQGFASAASNAQPAIYVGFSNCVPPAGASGGCGASSTSTANDQRAGTIAADYVASGTADVRGVWFDVESDWSTVAAVHAEVQGYLSVNPAKTGHGDWCDSTYRNYASGLPNSTWTVAAMIELYVSPLVNAGYTCLGAQRILIPQAYAASWLTDGTANFSPASSLARYVGGITVCGASEASGRCPDLGIPGSTGGATKWSDYARDGYAPATSSVLAVVGGSALKIAV
jgi:peptidoglycan hydrolase-like protein with peptidoglycan-binding domain